MSGPECLPGDARYPAGVNDAVIRRAFGWDDRDEDDDDGWNRGRCPRCHRSVWVESGCVFECSCGYSEVDDEEDEDA